MDSICVNIAPDSIYHIRATATRCGSDWNVAVCGGSAHHVGAVALAVYEPVRDSATVSTLSVYTHRDDRVASRMAKELSRTLKCTVCVSAGIHIDHVVSLEVDDEEITQRMSGRRVCTKCGAP